jgi:hypothetical protein
MQLRTKKMLALYEKLVDEGGHIISDNVLWTGVDYIRHYLGWIVCFNGSVPVGKDEIERVVGHFWEISYNYNTYHAAPKAFELHEGHQILGIRNILQTLDTHVKYEYFAKGRPIYRSELRCLFQEILIECPFNIDFPKRKNIWTELFERLKTNERKI